MTPRDLLVALAPPCAAAVVVTLLLGVMAGWMIWPRGRRW